MHWWPRLPAPTGDGASRSPPARPGSRFLVAALRAEGLRESALTSTVVVGPAVLTATASASASLYYYVLTAFCLLLGFAGLALGETLSRWLAPRPAAELRRGRVAGDRRALPAREERGSRAPRPGDGGDLARSRRRRVPGHCPGARMAGARSPRCACSSRTPSSCAASWRSSGVLATRLGLGTHYDVSALTSVPVALTGSVYAFTPGGWGQVFWLLLVPQLVVWPVFTVATGLLGGAVARAARRFV